MPSVKIKKVEFSVSEAANFLGVSPDTLRRWDNKGLLKSARTLSGYRIYTRQDLENAKNRNVLAEVFTEKVASQEKGLQIDEAAKLIGVSKDTLRRWESLGKISSKRSPSGYRLFNPVELKQIAKESSFSSENEGLLTGQRAVEGTKGKAESSELSSRATSERSHTISEISHPDFAEPRNDSNLGDANGRFYRPINVSKDTVSDQSSTVFDENNVFGSKNEPTEPREVVISNPLKGSSKMTLGLISCLLLLLGVGGMIGLRIRAGLSGTEVASVTKEAKVKSDSAVLAATNPNFKLDISVDTSVEGTLSAKSLRLSDTVSQIVMGENLTVSANQQASSRVATIPVLSGDSTFLFTDQAQTVTNKNISGSANTLTNIPNSALTNSGVTINTSGTLTGGGVVALGGTITLTGAASGVTSLTAGTDISVSGSTGGVTVSNSSTLASVTGRGATTTTALTLNGAVAMGSTLGVTGATTLSSTMTVVGNVGIGTTNVSSGLLAVGSSSQLLVNSTGNLTKINNVAYSWPSSSAGGNNYVLTSQTDGTLAWTTGSAVFVPWNSIDDPDGNQTLAMAAYTTTWNWATATTGNQLSATANALTTGTLFDLSSTSTTGDASKLLSLTRSGTNGTASKTNYGLYSAITNTGTTSTNVAGYFSASGGTNNYAGIFEAGNVGIGTTAPARSLSVYGSGDNLTSGSVTFTNASDGTSAGALAVFVSGTSTPASGYIGAFNGSYTGITGYGDSLVISAQGDASNGILLNPQVSGSPIRFWNNGSEAMRIVGGNVGIGTTAPSTGKLQVEASAALVYVKSTTSTNFAELQLTNTTNALQLGVEGSTGGSRMAGTIAYGGYLGTYSAYPLTLHTNNAVAMTILSGGNVGIGTTTPSLKLDVEFDTAATNTPASVAALTTTSSGTVANGFGARLSFDAETATANTLDQIAAIGGVWEDATAGTVDGALVFETRINSGSFTEKMRVTSGGNVGIGTAANITAKQVVLAGTSTSAIQWSEVWNDGSAQTMTGSGAGMRFRLYAYEGTGTTKYAGIAGVSEADYGDNIGLALYTRNGYNTDPTEKMRITAAGNVGIGTTGPTAKLVVSGGATVLAADANSVANGIQIAQSGSDIAFTTDNYAKNINLNAGSIFVKANAGVGIGNVGIGTTAPVASLNIVDNDESTTLTNFTQALSDAGLHIQTQYTSGAYTPGVFWSTSNDNGTKPKAGIWLLTDGSGSDMYFGTSNNYATGITNNGMILDQTGNLTIASTANVGSYVRVGTAASVGYVALSTGTATAQGYVEWYNSAGTRKAYMGWDTAASAGNIQLKLENSAKLEISGGAVGIAGTPSGTYSLEILGTLKGTGSVTFSGLTAGPGQDYVCINGNGGAGVLQSSAGACGSSDARLKMNIETISSEVNVLEALDKLHGVYYNWDLANPYNAGRDNARQIGMIAQDVELVLPELVTKDPDANGYRHLDYPKLTAFLVEVAKAQQAQFESLATTTGAAYKINSEGVLEVPAIRVGKLILDPNLDLSGTANAEGTLSFRIMNLEDRIRDLEEGSPSTGSGNNWTAAIDTLNSEVAASNAAIAGIATESAALASRTDTLEQSIEQTSSTLSKLQELIDGFLGSGGLTPADSGADRGETPKTVSVVSDGDLNLTPPEVLIASGSATLANINVSEKITTLKLESTEATIAGALKSLGETYLGNTVVAGSFSQDGTLSITGGNSINSIALGVEPLNRGSTPKLGVLYIQNSPLAGLVDFFNGKVTIDKNGVLAIERLVVGNKTLGSAVIPAGENSIEVSEVDLSPTSRVFTSTNQAVSVGVATKDVAHKKFRVVIPTVALTDLTVDWWVVDGR